MGGQLTPIPTRPVRDALIPKRPIKRIPSTEPSAEAREVIEVTEFGYLPPIKDTDGTEIKLSRKARLFVEYYCRGMSALKSARLAGYSEGAAVSASSSILDNVGVRAALRQRQEKRFRELQLNTNMVLDEARKLAFSNIMDYIEVEPDGSFKVDLTAVNRDLGSAVQELSYDMAGRPRIKLADKKASLELLARCLKMLTDKVEVSGAEGKPLTIQHLDQLIQQHITINHQQVQAAPVTGLSLPPGVIEDTTQLTGQ